MKISIYLYASWLVAALLCLIAPQAQAQDYAAQRVALVDAIREDVSNTAAQIQGEPMDPRVVEAMKTVPRHEFVPEDSRELAYLNRPLPIGYGQTISQPYVVALMTELLDPQPG
ncbi:MAG: protein-L-isoaspartate O-methyltransferase family protein, partial [Oceanidesulfovibrio sp.]